MAHQIHPSLVENQLLTMFHGMFHALEIIVIDQPNFTTDSL